MINMNDKLITVSVVSFAVIFFGVGVYRVIEFKDIGLGETQRKILVCLHIIGCALFSVALASVALWPEQTHRNIILFVLGLGFLAPGQFTAGLRRRSLAAKESQGPKVKGKF
jgi:hypothetical protein